MFRNELSLNCWIWLVAMANKRLIFLACNICSILAEYSIHGCTFRWVWWPMGLWFTICTEQVRFLYIKHAVSGLPNPTRLDGEVRFIQAQDQQVLPYIYTVCLQEFLFEIKMKKYTRHCLIWNGLVQLKRMEKSTGQIWVKQEKKLAWLGICRVGDCELNSMLQHTSVAKISASCFS